MNEFKDLLNEYFPTRTSGSVLKANRTCLNLSLETLSSKTGIGLNTLTQYENDKLAINHKDSKLLARELGILSKSLRNP